MKNIVVPRINPQLIRKKPVARKPTGGKAAPIPQQRKSVKLRDLNRDYTPPSIPSRPIVVQPKTLKRQTSNVRKKPKVQYRTYDPMPVSPDKIKMVRSIGRGKILVIIGNGPSINQVPLERLKDIPKVEIMSVNAPDPRVWPTEYWSFFDKTQIKRHHQLWENYEGYIFNSPSIREQKKKSMQFRNGSGKGWSRDLVQCVEIGRSSVYATMQIAQWMEFEHVYLFGVDMNPDGIDGQLHFYGVNPDVEPSNRAQRFEKEAKFFSEAAEVLTEEERNRFTFCSLGINPWPFIGKFGACVHKEAIDIIAEHAKELSSEEGS